MIRLSPSSRLMAGVLVAALAVLYLVGSVHPSVPSSSSPTSAIGLGGDAASTSPTESGAPEASPSPTNTAGPGPSGTTRPRATPRPTAKPTSRPAASACRPTDQDRYVYNPARLEVLRACIRVTGTVAAIRKEADGDLHILLALDPAYRSLLRPANQGEELGDLVVEPVCVRSVTQADAVAICVSDPDPLPNVFPVVGEHVWMEGRYVLDLDHGGWAELHPLYRWGPA
jgi:hypothetical protein